MHTSIAVLALFGAISPQLNRLNVSWEQDYAQARVVSARESKPICVFVGQGAGGWKQLLQDGDLSTETRVALIQKYVPVYVDQTTSAGQRLAAAFHLTGKTGLIISDRTGAQMAFRHEGTLAAADMNRHLVRFADPALVVSTTEGHPVPPPVAAPQPSTSLYQNAFQNPYQQCRT